MMDILGQVEITFDHDYTRRLNEEIVQQYGSTVKRVATHLSDLLYCLRKGWGRLHIPGDEWRGIDPEEDPMFMWAQGLQFESLVAEGEQQGRMAYCFKCRAVSSPPSVPSEEEEVAKCPVCEQRWLVATPDWKADGLIHESKQTRKSQRRGVRNAPWWIEQVVSYMLFDRLKTAADPPFSRLVVNWLMGDYGNKRKGTRPLGPKSVLEAHQVKYTGSWEEWLAELHRRKQLVEGNEMPLLDFKESPKYPWECASCQVGQAMKCPQWIWDDDDKETYPFGDISLLEVSDES
jgi:hypothetical protein